MRSRTRTSLAIRTWLNGRMVQGGQHQQHDPQGGGADRVHQHLHPPQPGRRDHHRLAGAGGVGKKRNPPLFMKEGDRIEVEIEHIGHLSNVIVEAPAVGLAAAH